MGVFLLGTWTEFKNRAENIAWQSSSQSHSHGTRGTIVCWRLRLKADCSMELFFSPQLISKTLNTSQYIWTITLKPDKGLLFKELLITLYKLMDSWESGFHCCQPSTTILKGKHWPTGWSLSPPRMTQLRDKDQDAKNSSKGTLLYKLPLSTILQS